MLWIFPNECFIQNWNEENKEKIDIKRNRPVKSTQNVSIDIGVAIVALSAIVCGRIFHLFPRNLSIFVNESNYLYTQSTVEFVRLKRCGTNAVKRGAHCCLTWIWYNMWKSHVDFRVCAAFFFLLLSYRLLSRLAHRTAGEWNDKRKSAHIQQFAGVHDSTYRFIGRRIGKWWKSIVVCTLCIFHLSVQIRADCFSVFSPRFSSPHNNWNPNEQNNSK